MASPPPATSSAAPPSPTVPDPKPFRFKTTKRSRSPDPTASQPRKRHRRRHRRSHNPPSTPRTRTPSPDALFRSSLFSALQDDDAAAYWSDVYGQPLHTYSPYTTDSRGELERMDDEEYVSYVRGKMWEKSHGFVVEERARREEERRRMREREMEYRQRDRERERGTEERRRRGKEGVRRDRWRGVWGAYLEAWEKLRSEVEGVNGKDGMELSKRIRWPVESGRTEDVGNENVEAFFMNAPFANRDNGDMDLQGLLKAERVRWHPDKIQQRYGGLGVDEGTRRAVTAVFQVVDKMWSEVKGC